MLLNILLSTILFLVVIVILSTIYNYYNHNLINNIQNKHILLELNKIKNNNLNMQLENVNNSKKLIKTSDMIMDDLVTELDIRTAYDPLSEPTRRPARHIITPVIGNPYFNYPTRGFTDTYSLQGYLVKEDYHKHEKKYNTKINNINSEYEIKHEENIKENNNKESNQIIKLFGREKYPNSTEYEYYVIINNGYNDNIKYFLENQIKELYNGDYVYIDILKSKYKVKMLKNKTFQYNPYLI